MKLNVKHLYFDPEDWQTIKDALSQILKDAPDLTEFDAVLLSTAEHKRLGDVDFLSIDKPKELQQ